jgi:hypothetical protein
MGIKRGRGGVYEIGIYSLNLPQSLIFIIILIFKESILTPITYPEYYYIAKILNNMSSPLDQVKEYSSKVEEAVLQYSAPIKPYLPMISRFLIVITFYEDAARLIFQWGEQNRYLTSSLGFPTFTSEIFLFLNIVVSKLSHLIF